MADPWAEQSRFPRESNSLFWDGFARLGWKVRGRVAGIAHGFGMDSMDF